jgi:peptidoglycan/LPS O-acetylase OafA/YrhL
MNKEVLPLTGLRGIAALWVFLYHGENILRTVYRGSPYLLKVLWGAGDLGVDVFFILSGFVLAYTYGAAGLHRSPGGYASFLVKRLARIYPVHIAALVLLLLLLGAFALAGLTFLAPSRLTFGGLLHTLALTHAWSFPIAKTWNTVSWSISCEWAAYLLFPLIAAGAQRFRAPWQLRLTVVLLFVLLTVYTQLTHHDGNMAYGMPRLAAGFCAGVLLHRLWVLRGAAVDLKGDRLAFLGLLLLAAAGTGLREIPFTLRAAAGCLVVYGLASARGPLASVLSTRLALFAGRISYAFYMVHLLVLLAAARAFVALGLSGFGKGVAMVVTAFIVSVLLATWIHRVIEEPARKAITRWVARDTRTDRAAVNPAPS